MAEPTTRIINDPPIPKAKPMATPKFEEDFETVVDIDESAEVEGDKALDVELGSGRSVEALDTVWLTVWLM